MPNNKTYIDSTGLGRFLKDLKDAYTNGTAGFTVKNAEFATYAAGENTTIPNTYLKIADASSTYVPLTREIAGNALSADISASTLRTSLNVIELEGVKIKGRTNNEAYAADSKVIELDLDEYAKTADLASVLDFKGVKSYRDQLPTTGQKAGDVWLVKYDGVSADEGTTEVNLEYVWAPASENPADDAHWEPFGTSTNLGGYATETWVTNNFVGQNTYVQDQEAVANKIEAIYKAGTSGGADTGLLPNEIARATAAEEALDGRLYILEGADSVSGSVANSIKTAIEGLDVSEVGGSGKILTTISEADGKISATAEDLIGTIPTGNTTTSTTLPPTAAAVKSYVDTAVEGVSAAVDNLDYDGATTGYYVTQVTQTNGLIAVTREAKGSVVSGNTALVDGGTVYTAVDGATTYDESNVAINKMSPMSNADIDALFSTT